MHTDTHWSRAHTGLFVPWMSRWNGPKDSIAPLDSSHSKSKLFLQGLWQWHPLHVLRPSSHIQAWNFRVEKLLKHSPVLHNSTGSFVSNFLLSKLGYFIFPRTWIWLSLWKFPLEHHQVHVFSSNSRFFVSETNNPRWVLIQDDSCFLHQQNTITLNQHVLSERTSRKAFWK